MKNASPLVVAVCLAGSLGMLALSAQQGAVFKDGQAEAIFRGAQAAVGHGEGKVVGLRTIVAKGRSKVVVGEGDPVDAQVEIRVLLPDHTSASTQPDLRRQAHDRRPHPRANRRERPPVAR